MSFPAGSRSSPSPLACFSSIAGSPSEEVEVDRPPEPGPLDDSSPAPVAERLSCGGISPSTEISEASWQKRGDDAFLARLRRLRLLGGSRLRDAAPRSRARRTSSKKRSSPVPPRGTSGSYSEPRGSLPSGEHAEDRYRLVAAKEIALSWRYLLENHVTIIGIQSVRSSGLRHPRSVIARRAFEAEASSRNRPISEDDGDEEGRNRANRETEDGDWNDLLRS